MASSSSFSARRAQRGNRSAWFGVVLMLALLVTAGAAWMPWSAPPDATPITAGAAAASPFQLRPSWMRLLPAPATRPRPASTPALLPTPTPVSASLPPLSPATLPLGKAPLAPAPALAPHAPASIAALHAAAAAAETDLTFAQLLVTIPATAAIGIPVNISVTAIYNDGTVDDSYIGAVHFTSTDGNINSVLPADYTFNGSEGTHTFPVTFATAGFQNVTATDPNSGSPVSGTSGTVKVETVTLLNTTASNYAFTSGSVAVGGSLPTPETVKIEIRADLVLSSIAIPGGNDFSVTDPDATNCPTSGGTTSAGRECDIKVQFSPTAPGTRSAPLLLTDSGGHHYAIGLSAQATGAALAFTPGTIGTLHTISSPMQEPFFGTVDSAGNQYIADDTAEAVWKVDTGGNVTLVAGRGTNATGCFGHTDNFGDGCLATEAILNAPESVRVDAAGNLYIADSSNNAIREVDASTGTIATIAGTIGSVASFNGDGGPATAADLDVPADIAVDAAGNLYIADTNNSRIRRVDGTTGIITTVVGNGTLGYAGDAGASTDAGVELRKPTSVELDSLGDLFIADTNNNVVRVVNNQGHDATINGVSVPAGDIQTIAGGGGNPSGCTGSINSIGDGCSATQATMSFDSSVRIDTAGDLYISDQNDAVVRRVGIDGTISTLAGGGADTPGDGEAATDAAISPQGAWVDNSGNVYFNDYNTETVRTVAVLSGRGNDFGSTYVGTTVGPQTEWVYNVGNQNLDFTSLILDNLDSFKQVSGNASDCTSSTALIPGATCLLRMDFQPTAVQTYNATISVNGNGLALKGEGHDNPGAGASLSPLTHDYSTVNVGATVVEAFTLTNPGDSDLTALNSIVVAGTDFALDAAPGSCFSSGTTPVGSLSHTAPNNTCTINVDFAPSAARARSGTLTLTDSVGTQIATLLGTGHSATPAKVVFTTEPGANYYAGATITVQASIEQSDTSVVTSGTGSTDTITVALSANPGSATLGGTLSVPAVAGVATFTLTVDQPGAGYTLSATDNTEALTTDTSSSFTVYPITYNLGSEAILSTTSATTVTFIAGAAQASSIAVLTQGASSKDFAGTDVSCTSATTAGNTCTVHVTFTPAAAGTRAGAVELLDGSGNILQTIYLIGTGTGPQIAFDHGTSTPQQTWSTKTGSSAVAGIAVDGNGNVFQGEGTTLVEVPKVGGIGAAISINSSFTSIAGVALDGAGNLLVTDAGANKAYELAATSSGGFGAPVALGTGLSSPTGIAVDASGNVFIADDGNNRIVEEPRTATGWGAQILVASSAGNPKGVAVDAAGNVYVAGGSCIEKAAWSGSAYGSLTPAQGVGSCQGVVVDARDNLYYVTSTTVEEALWNGSGYPTKNTLASGLNSLKAIAIDGAGNLYVTNSASSGAGETLRIDRADAPALAFADTVAHTTSSDSPQTVNVANIGNTSLTFNSITYPTDFPVNTGDGNRCATTLAPGILCDLSVNFTPTTTGSLTGESVALSDTSLNASPASQALALSGNGTVGAASTLAFLQQPTSTVAGTTMSPAVTVAVEDAHGNIVTSLTGTNTISLALTGNGVLTGGSATLDNSTGIATFSGLSVNLVGTGDTVTASGLSLTGATSNGFDIAAGAATSFAVAGTPANVYAGSSFNFTVTALDANGNTATGFADTVTFTSTAAGVLPAPSSAFTNGVGSFSATLNTVGTSQTITATDGGKTGTSTGIGVWPTSYNFGSEPVASTTASTAVTFVSTGVAIGSVVDLIQGAPDKEFKHAGGGTCSGTIAIGSTCLVNVAFTPAAPGPRLGAVELLDGSGNILQTIYLNGNGTGPQIAFASSAITPTTLTATSLNLQQPRGIAFDGNGDLFVATQLTSEEQLFRTGQAQVVELAWNGSSFTQRTIMGSPLTGPTSVALDGAGNLFIVDGSGTVYELPWNGTSFGAPLSWTSLNSPVTVAADAAGDLFFACGGSGGSIVEWPRTSSGFGAAKTIAAIAYADGIAVDASGNLFVTEGSGDNKVYEIPLSAGAYGAKAALTTSLTGPFGMAFDNGGNLYITEGGGHRTVELPWNGSSFGAQTTLITSSGQPYGIAVAANGNLFVSDFTSYDIVELDQADAPPLTFASTGIGSSAAAQSITVTNIGNADLNLSAQAFTTGTDYNSNGTTCSTSTAVSSGTSCTLSVVFAPTATGTRTDTYTLTDNSLNAASATQAVNLTGTGAAGALDHFLVTAVSPETAGASFSVTVTAQDAGNNTLTTYTGTPAFTTSDTSTGGNAPVLPSGAFVTGDHGVHTYTGVTFFKARPDSTIVATDGGATGHADVEVDHAAASQILATSGSGSTAVVYTGTYALTATVEDQYGNPVGSNSVTFAAVAGGNSQSAAITSGNPTTSIDSGAATAALTANNFAGIFTVTATATGVATPASFTLTNTPGAVDHFTVTGAPANVYAGSSFNFTVTALDAFGNTVTAFADSVNFSSTDGVAVLPSNGASLTSGVGSFSATLNTLGSQTLIATDAASSPVTGTSPAINVVAASYNLGAEPVLSTTSPATSITFIAGSTQATAIAVLTQGATTKDFAGTDVSCTTATTSGNTCTVNVTFTPSVTGTRMGAVELLNGSTILQTIYISGVGTAPIAELSTASSTRTLATLLTSSGVNSPDALTGDSNGHILIAEHDIKKILQYTIAGGATADVTPTGVSFGHLTGVAVDGAGNIFILDQDNKQLYEQKAGTTTATSIWTDPAGGSGDPLALAVDAAGNLYVAEVNTKQIFKLTAGTFTQSVYVASSNNIAPTAMAFDTADNFYFGGESSSVYRVPAGGGSAVAVSHTSTASDIEGLAVDAAGDLFISDNTGVQELPQGGSSVVTLANSFGAGGLFADGAGKIYLVNGYSVTFDSLDLTSLPSPALTFSSTSIGNSSAAQAVTVTNVGNADLNISAQAFTANTDYNTNGSSTTCSTTAVASASSCTLSLVFEPTTVGTLTDTYTLTDNVLNASNATQTMNLTGTGAPGAPAKVVFTTEPASSYTSGATFSVAATIEDAGGNIVSSDSNATDSVTLAFQNNAGPGADATLSGTLTVSAIAGVATFSGISVDKAGTGYTLKATDTTSSIVSNPVSSAFAITPGAAASFTVVAPGSALASFGTGVTVTALDAAGNIATGFTGTVHFTSTDPSAALPADYTFTLGDAGVHAFSGVTFFITGSQTVTAADGGVTGASGNVTVSALTSPVNTAYTATTPVVTVTLPAGGTIASLASSSVYTAGAAASDFTFTSGGSCDTVTTYTAGATCTVDLAFTPTAPGARPGAVVLKDSGNNVLGTAYFDGVGTSPLVTFDNSSSSQVAFTDPSNLLDLPSAHYQGIAIDGAGTLYLASHTQFKIYSVPAGTSTPNALSLDTSNLPSSIAVDAAGTVYTQQGASLYRFAAGQSSPQEIDCSLGGCAGSGANGIAVDAAGNVWAPMEQQIVKFAAGTGAQTAYCASCGIGTTTGATGVAVDSTGNLYIADPDNNRVIRLAAGSSSPTFITTGFGSNPLATDLTVATDALGNLYIADGTSGIVEYPGGAGTAVLVAPLAALGNRVYQMAIDSHGNVYAATAANYILKIDRRTPPALTFPTTAVSATSASQTVSVHNFSNADLTFASSNGVTFDANFPNQSSVCATAGTIAAGSSCNLIVAFHPPSAGSFAGAATLTDNDLNASAATQAVTLSGATFGALDHFAVTAASPETAGAAFDLTVTAQDASNNTVLSYTGTPVITTSDASTGGAPELPSAAFTGGDNGVHTYTGGVTLFTAATGVTLTATAGGPTGHATLTVQAAAAANLAATSGAGQSAVANIGFTNPVVATVTDQYGNPVSGVAVGFAAPTSTAGATLTASVNTDTAGHASDPFTANHHAGSYNITASASGLTSVTFNETNTADVPATVASTSGTPQSAQVSTAFGSVLVATVTDQYGNPVSGATVTFTAPASGASGTFANSTSVTTAVTGSDGKATSSAFTANSISGGPYNVVASTGSATSANFALTNTAQGQTISFTLASPVTYGVAPITLSATATSSLTVAFSVVSGPGTISGNTLTVTGPGSIVVAADQAGNATFAAAPQVRQTLVVNSAQVPTTPVGTPVGPEPVIFYVPSGISVASIKVVTQGLTGLDFTDAVTNDNCVGTLAAGSTCTVNVTFTPRAPGLRLGAVELLGSGNSILQTLYISGIGQSAVAAFAPAAGSTVGSGLTQPSGVAVDAAGNVFVSDSSNSSPAVVEFPAGGGSSINLAPNFTGFNAPAGLAVDGAGNVYVADQGASEVFEIPAGGTSAATLTKIESGFFTSPSNLAVDAVGNLYVVDIGASSLYKVPVGGGAPTYPAAADLGSPTAVAADGAGNIFIADSSGTGLGGEIGADVIQVAPGGTVTVVTCVSGCSAANGSLSNPTSLALDPAGNLYIGDSTAGVVFKLGSGALTTLLPGASLSGNPVGVAVDGKGEMYLTENGVTGGVSTYTQQAPSALSFSTTAGTPATTQSFSVANIGNLNLNFFGAVPTAGTPSNANASFPSTGTACAVGTAVAAGANCQLTYGFTSTAATTVTETDTVYDNSLLPGASSTTNAASQTVSLSGAATAAAAATVTATSGTPQSAQVSTAFTNVLVATVTDQYGNPIAGATVTFTAPASGASGTFANSTNVTTAVTGSDGKATSSVFTANSTSGGPYNVVASTGSATSANFTLTNTAQGQTISFTLASPVTYGVAPITLSASATSSLTVAFSVSGPGSVSGNTLTVTGAGSIVVSANQAGNSTFASAPQVQQTLVVTQAPLVITASSPSVAYGTVPTITPSYATFVNGDTAASLTTAPVCTTSATSTSAVGTAPTTACSGAVDANYAITYVTGAVTITKATTTTTWSPNSSSIVYGTSLNSILNANGTGAITYTTGGNTVTTTSVLPVTGSPYTITATSAGDSNHNGSTDTYTLTVTPAPLAITASSPSMNFGGSAPTITASYATFVNGDTATSLTTAPVCTTTASSTSPVGTPVATSCSGTVDPNYSITYVAGAVTVTKATTTTTWSPNSSSIVYGTSLAGILNASGTGAVTYTNGATPVAGATVLPVTGSPYTLTATSAGDANHNGSTATYTLTVTPAPLAITASSPSMNFGDAAPAVTASYATFVNGDTASSLTTAPACTTVATSTSAVGSSPATSCSGAVDPNYAISYVPGAVSITKATTTTTWSPNSGSIVYGTSLAGVLNASGTGAVTYANGETPVTGTTVLPVTGSPYTLTAASAGDSNHTGSTATYTLTVTPAPLTITASSPSMNFGGTVPTITPSYATFVNGDTATSLTTAPVCTTTATATSAVGSTPATSCSGAADPNYSITYAAGAITIAKATTTTIWSPNSGSVVYGTSLAGVLNASGTGTITYAVGTTPVTASTVLHVTGSPYTITATSAGDSNHSGNSTTYTLTVTQAPLVVTASSPSMAFGSTVPTITPSYATFVNGDTAASLATRPVCTTTATASSHAGSSQTTACSGAADPDYSISYGAGTVTVTQASQTITFTPPGNHIYGEAPFSLSATATSGLTVSFSVTSGPATVSGSMITLTGPGTVIVQATQTGNTDYGAATPVNQTIQVSQALAVNLSATSLDFGSVPVGSSSSAQSVIITNSSLVPVQLTSAVASGDFAASSNCATIAAGASCTVSVTFTPSSTGARSGILTLTDNAAGSPQTVPLTGTGTAAGVLVTPTSLIFGSQVVTTTSTGQTITILNTGTAALHVSNIAITGDFGVTGNCGLVPAGSNCSFSVTFTPTQTGSRTGTVVVTDDAGGGSQTVNLAGTGSVAGAVLAPSSLTFSGTQTGTVSGSLAASLTNTGTAPLTGIAFSVQGDFAQTNTCSTALAAGASCVINVTFDPTLAGAESGSVTVTDNLGQQVLSLAGTGLAPGLSVSAAQLIFGGQLVDTVSSAQTVTVVNSGAGPLSITGVATSTGFVNTTNCGGTLAAGATCSVNISFAPTSAGAQTGTAVISTATASAATVKGPRPATQTSSTTSTIILQGQAVSPGLAVTPSFAIFGSQEVGTTSLAQTLTATNTGTVPLTLQPITVSSDFLETNQCPATLAPGTSCLISLSFAPSAVGTRSGALTISDTAGLASSLVTLSGQGTLPGIAAAPSTLSFGSLTVGTTSQAQTVTVTNTGTAPLSIGSVTPNGDFAETNNCTTAPIAAGAYCVVNVTMTPTTIGTRTGSIQITDNADGGHTIALSGVGQAAGISIFPTSLAFGSLPIPIPGAQVTLAGTLLSVTLTNTGNIPLALDSISLQGNFNQTNSCGTSIAPGAVCFLTVSFNPTALGHRTGSLTITDNAGAGTQVVALQGDGSPGGLTLTPPVLNFGVQVIGVTSKPLAAVLSNNTGVGITNLVITPSGEYNETNDCGSTLADGSSCNLNISITPVDVGAITGTVTVSGTLGSGSAASPASSLRPSAIRAQAGSEANFSLGVVAMTATAIPPGIGFSIPELSFSVTAVGTASTGQTITLQNTGNVLSLTGLNVAGTNVAEFPFSTTCPATLGPLATCTITVNFTPKGAGQRTGFMNITADGGISAQMPESGVGIGPLLTVAPSSLSFGSRPVASTSASQTLLLQNTGGLPLSLTGIAASGDYAVTASTCALPQTLAVNASCTVSVAFTPTATGTRNGALTLVSNSTSGNVVVALGGSSNSAGLTFSPGSLAFGARGVGSSSPAQTVTITNQNTAAVGIASIAIAPGGNYTQTNNCSTSLAAGASCTMAVIFTPTATGEQDASIAITNDAGVQVIPVTGSGSDFAITYAGNLPAAVTLGAGSQTTYHLGLTSLSGDNQTIALTCAADTGFSCSVAPTSVAIGAQPGTFVLTLVSNARVVGAAVPPLGGAPTDWGSLLALLGYALALLLLMAAFFRRRRVGLTLAGAGMMLLFSAACGTPTPPTNPSTHHVTVTAVSSTGNTHTKVLDLVVE